MVAGLVRGEKANDALNQLKFTPKKAAKILYKIINSAVSNAKNNFDQNEENLYIKSILVTKGITFKRGMPVSRGRSHPILKRNTNITVEIGLVNPTQEKPKAKKDQSSEEKTTETSEKKTAKKSTETKKTPAKKTLKKKTAAKNPLES